MARGLHPVLAPNLYELGVSVEAWAAGVLQRIGTEPCVVVGCSVGGSCALEIARAAPEQVAAVVLVGAKAGVRSDPAMRDDAIRVLETRGVDAAWDQYWAPLFGRKTPPEVTLAARELARAQGVDDLVRGVRAFHDRRDLTAWVARWRRPLVVISGRRIAPHFRRRLRSSGSDRRVGFTSSRTAAIT